ncbi:MAG: hypothetical protein JXM70_00800 [Pirellulales bacterium]|nr:hypothetical protein [Pirellulales bacterium]
MFRTIFRVVLIVLLLVIIRANDSSAAESTRPAQPVSTPFETDARGAPPKDSPVVRPWRVVTIDPEYGGYWVVVGDIDGDRNMEIVSAKNHNRDDVHFTSSVVAQRFDGSVLWRWGDPKLGRRKLHHDVACQIHDLDGDGTNEVVVAGKGEVIVLEGATGKPRHRFVIEMGASDCILFADLSGKGRASDIIVKTRYSQIWAYTSDGKLLWTAQKPGGYRTAHRPLPVDLDGDGHDELLAGYAALNHDGSIRWVFEADPKCKNGGHADCWRVVRLAKNPENTRLAMSMCSGDALVMTDGNGRLIWKKTGHHYESVDVGDICPQRPGLEIAVDIDHLRTPKKPLCIFDEQGNLLGKIITDYTRQHILTNWNGDGTVQIGSALPRGLFDGRGRRLLTFDVGPGEKPRLMAAGDMCGNGREDVLLTTISPDGCYKAYIFKNPNQTQKPGYERPPSGTGPNFTLY